MKTTQYTFGEEEPDFKSRNMKIIKSGSVKFYSSTHQTPESVIDDLEGAICGVECGPGTMRGEMDY